MDPTMTTLLNSLPRELRDYIYEEAWAGTDATIGSDKINYTCTEPLLFVDQEIQEEYEQFCKDKVLKHTPTITCNVTNFNFLRVMQLMSEIEETSITGLSDFIRSQDGTSKRKLVVKLSFSGYRDPEELAKFIRYLNAKNCSNISITYEFEQLDGMNHIIRQELGCIQHAHPQFKEIVRGCMAYIRGDGGA